MDKEKSKTGPLLFFIFSIAFYIYIIFLFVTVSYRIDFFDKTMAILAKIYSAQGFIPYKDFAVVYPPGNFLLFGKLFHYSSEPESNFIFIIIYLFIIGISIYILNKLLGRKDYFKLSLFIILNAFILRVYGENFSLVLVTLISLSSLYFLKTGIKKYLFLLLPLYLFGVWFRWDWLIALAGVQWVILLVLLLFLLAQKDKVKKITKYIKRELFVATMSVVGAFGGVLTLYVYLTNLGVLSTAYEFFIVIPMMLTRTFRNLPLPPPKLPTNPDSTVYIAFIVIVLLIINLIKNFIEKFKGGKSSMLDLIVNISLIFYTLIFLPYTLGRSDWFHFIPIWYMTGLSFVLINMWNRDLIKLKNIMLVLFFIPQISWIINDPGFTNPQSMFGEKIINLQNDDCKKIVENIKPESILVGRISYQKYLYNITSLYFIFPDVKPATPFIAEEPGIQSSCKYGAQVASYLEKAQQPLIAFLEKGSHPNESKYTEQMSSCGKVESFLESGKYEKIGDCESYGLPFEVRLYK